MKINFSSALFAASLLCASGVNAGSSSTTQVQFFETNGLKSAKGVLSVARYSSDRTQYIGCSIYSYDSGGHSLNCNARLASGDVLGCHSGDENMIAVARNLNPASYLYFVVNSNGSCDRVISVNASYNIN